MEMIVVRNSNGIKRRVSEVQELIRIKDLVAIVKGK